MHSVRVVACSLVVCARALGLSLRRSRRHRCLASRQKRTLDFLTQWLLRPGLQLRNVIKSVLVGTDHMRADDKTKVVDKKKFMMCRRATMNFPPDMPDS